MTFLELFARLSIAAGDQRRIIGPPGNRLSSARRWTGQRTRRAARATDG